MLIIVYIILLILGAKSAWKLVQNLIPTSVDGGLGLAIAILIFVVPFLIIGPIMGIVTLGKYLIIRYYSRTPKIKEKIKKSDA